MRLKHAKVTMPEVNMVPMIDIVFQLIIFFLIAMQIKKDELTDLTLPGSRYATEVREEKDPPLIVNILPPKVQDGQPNKPFYCMGNAFDLAGFKKFMKNRETFYFEVKKVKDMPIVRVRADTNAEYQQIQDCLIACREAKVWQVRLTTIKREY